MNPEVIVGADISPLRAQLAVAVRDVQAFGSRITGAFRGIRDSIGNIGNIVGAIGAVKLAGLADQAALLQARLKDVTGSATVAADAQKKLFAVAQNLQVGYADLTGSFARMMPAIKALGGGVNETVRLAEILSISARLSGASSAEAAASALQFAQALGSGVLQGDELRSILEGNQALARTLADAIGISVGELKKWGAEGKLTSDLVANALLGKYDELKRRSSELPQTVGGAWTRIENEFMRFVESINNGTSVFSSLVDILNEVARVIAAVARSFSVAGTESQKLGKDTGARTWARTIMEAFAGLVDFARLVKQAFVSVGSDIGAVAAAILQMAQGNFSTAFNILKQRGQDLANETKRMKDLWMGTGSSLLGSLRGQSRFQPGDDSTLDARDRMMGGGDAMAKLKSKGKTDDDKKKKKTPADPSFMSYYEAALEQEKRIESERDALREFSKQKELAYWQNILQHAKLSADDRLAIVRKIGDLEIDIRREKARESLDLERETALTQSNLALGAIEIRKAANRLALDEERITKQQYVALELELEAQKYNIQAQGLRRRMELAAKDPNTSPAERERLNRELLELEQQFSLRRIQTVSELSKKNNKDGKALFEGLANSWSTSLEYMLLRAKSWQDALRTLWNATAAVFIRTIVTEPLGKWLAMQAKMLAAKIGFGQSSAAVDATTSATTVATKTAEATAVIGAEGAKAGAGAAASQAAIPIVGPALAIGAMVAVLGAVLALRGKLKSAAKGYDIPSGVNPMVQLHEEEMVLPKPLARGVRSLVAGGESGRPSGGNTSITVHAIDAKSFDRFLDQNRSSMSRFARAQRRAFASP